MLSLRDLVLGRPYTPSNWRYIRLALAASMTHEYTLDSRNMSLLNLYYISDQVRAADLA